MVRLLALLLGQDLSLEGLRSDDPAERDAAEQRLQRVASPAWVIDVLAAERDPEVRVRLQAIRRRHLLKESDELYRAEKVVESLKKLLEAEGIADVEAEYGRRVKLIREEFQKATIPTFGCEIVSAQVSALAELTRRRGRWAYPPLLDMLSQDSRAFLALEVLKGKGPEVHPALRVALREAAEDQRRSSALMELHYAQHDKEALRALAEDATFSKHVRGLAQKFLGAR